MNHPTPDPDRRREQEKEQELDLGSISLPDHEERENPSETPVERRIDLDDGAFPDLEPTNRDVTPGTDNPSAGEGAEDLSPKEKIIASCREAAGTVAALCKTVEQKLANIPPLDADAIAELDVDQLQDLVEIYREAEEAMLEAVQGSKLATEVMTEKALPEAERIYKHRTGFLDDPDVNGKLALGSAVVGIALTAAGLYAGHHAISSAVHHIVSGHVGEIMTLVVDFFGLCVGSAIGSAAYGAFKTAVGRALGGEGIESSKKEAAEVQEELNSAVESTAESLTKLTDSLERFSRVTKELRGALSEVILERSGEAPRERPQSGDLPPLSSLEDFARSLRWHEPLQAIQLHVVQRKMLDLRDADVCPPDSFLASVYESGPKAAIAIAKRTKKHCEEIDPKPGDTVAEKLKSWRVGATAGFGKAMCGLLEMMVQGGVRLDEAVLDTLKGGLSLINTGKDKKEGPSIPELLYMVAAGDEIKKGNYSKATAEIGPNILLLAFKKIYFVVESERMAAARGEVSPGLINKDLRSRVDILRQWGQRVTEILGKVPEATVGALAKNLIERPLYLLSGNERCASLLHSWYGLRQAMLERGPLAFVTGREGGMLEIERSLESKLSSSLPPGATLRSLSYDDLKLLVMKRLVAFEKGEAGTDGKEIRDLLTYWEKRDKYEWLAKAQRSTDHGTEIGRVDEDLSGLRSAIARYNEGPDEPAQTWLGRMKAGLVEAYRAVTNSKDLESYINGYNAKALEPEKEARILDCANDGSLIVKDEDGKLRFLRGHLASRFVLDECWGRTRQPETLPIHVLPHADMARLSTTDKLLEMYTSHTQRQAILDVHYAALESEPDIVAESRKLLGSGFKLAHIFGATESGSGIRCLWRSGLLGNKVPSDDTLRDAEKSLRAEGYR